MPLSTHKGILVSLKKDCDDLSIEKIFHKRKLYIRKLHIEKGSNIFYDGDDSNFLHYIKSGFVSLEYSRPNGLHHIIQFSCPGEIIGMDKWPNSKHYLSAQAISHVELWSLSIKDVYQVMETDHELCEILDKLNNKHCVANQDHIFSLSIHNAEQKLAFFLFNFYIKYKDENATSNTMLLPMSRIDLTNHLGITAETLSRSFSVLEKKGLIIVKNRRVQCSNFAMLERIFL